MSVRATRWLEGRGLHGGAPVRARIVTEPSDREGVWFRRLDVAHTPAMRAEPSALGPSDGAYATTLVDAKGHAFARTIEHVMSALAGAALLRGVVVEIDADELPCLDGASAEWFDAIEAADLVGTAPALLTLVEPFVAHEGERSLSLIPADTLSIDLAIEFEPPIGAQRASWDGAARTYREEIATARTFATIREAEAMLANGLARGIDPKAAVVYGPAGPLVPLAAPNEPARHKLLDLVGDLALLGALPRAHVQARRPGHAFVARALRKLTAQLTTQGL